jgi:signal transduction histidine kinase
MALEEYPAFRALQGETTRGAIVLLGSTGDEVVWVSVSAAPIRSEDGEVLGAVAIFTDVTAQHKLEQAREEFLGLVSHDLRNPLTALQGQAQLLQRQIARRKHREELSQVETILRCADRMNGMIQDLVESTRLEAGTLQMCLEPTDLRALLEESVERVGTREDRRRVVLDLPASLPRVRADAEHLERLIANLLTNALKYSSPPGPIVVRAAAAEREVIVSVVDRGVGIPPDEVPHVFAKYFRARTGQGQRGLGLGLYIARLIAEAHDGRIWVESSVGEGSTFRFSLPLD